MFTLKFRVLSHNTKGLRNARGTLELALRKGLRTVGRRLERSARIRMKKDTGRMHKSLRSKVSGRGFNQSLETYSELIEAAVDAYGIKPRRVFPPYQPGTKLYKWTERQIRKGVFKPTYRRKRGNSKPVALNTSRSRVRASDTKKLSFMVARKIYRRGLPASHWNRQTLKANEAMVTRELANALSRAVNKINRG